MTTIALSAVVGAVVAIAIERLKQWYMRPVLALNGADFIDDETQERTFRIIVRNKGRTTAKACIAQVTVQPLGTPFSVLPLGIVSEAALYGGSSALDDQPLIWSGHVIRTETDIYPSLSRRIDLCSAQTNCLVEHVGFTIPSEPGYHPPLFVFSCPAFAYLVKVAGEGSAPLIVSGYVHWGQDNPTIVYFADVAREFLTPVTPYLTGYRSYLPGFVQHRLRSKELTK